MLSEEPCLVSDYKVNLSSPILFLCSTLNSASLGLFEVTFLMQSLREKVIFSKQRWNSDGPLFWTNSVPCWYCDSLNCFPGFTELSCFPPQGTSIFWVKTVREITNFFFIYWMKAWVEHAVEQEPATVCVSTVVTSTAILWRAVRSNTIVNVDTRYRVAVGRNTIKFPGWLRYFNFQPFFSEFYCCQKLVTTK